MHINVIKIHVHVNRNILFNRFDVAIFVLFNNRQGKKLALALGPMPVNMSCEDNFLCDRVKTLYALRPCLMIDHARLMDLIWVPSTA